MLLNKSFTNFFIIILISLTSLPLVFSQGFAGGAIVGRYESTLQEINNLPLEQGYGVLKKQSKEFQKQALKDPGLNSDIKEKFFSDSDNNLHDFADEFKKHIKRKYGLEDIDVPEGTKYANDILTYPDGSTIDLKSLAFKGHDIKFIDGKTYVDGKLITNGKNIREGAEGSILSDSLDSLSFWDTTLFNGQNIRYLGNTIYIEKAEILNSGCVTLRNIEETTVTTETAQLISLIANNGTKTEIQGCDDSLFVIETLNDDATVTVKKTVPTEVELTDVKLISEKETFKETFEGDKAEIIIDKELGFVCLLIMPVGTYFYNDKLLMKKDLAVNIPRYGNEYGLCLRKDPRQDYSDYDGLVNFVDSNIILTGIVNYLRYPLIKTNYTYEVKTIKLGNIYQGFENALASFVLLPEFILIDKLIIDAIPSGTASKTIPSNYYEIKEVTINNEIHRLVKPNFELDVNELTENLLFTYITEYFPYPLTIEDNVLIQEHDGNQIKILPPGHEEIEKILGK